MSVSVYSHPHNMGDDDGPLAADHYKRAVLRPAPSRFAIEFHEPTKVGGSSSYSFGMRVSPIIIGDRASVSSLGSSSEYDVWRRWEDCLWFQDNLELEYERLARQKRQRLAQGKGVKKHGFYLQDKASSFESLPPGPDPDSIKRDIHDYIPKLTKRGTIFRASPATIAQRDSELQAFVEALFKEDQPALIKEMRSTRLVTDFFGIWHRDAELASKKRKASIRESQVSITPSVFSSYFSAASTPSLSDSLAASTSTKSSIIKRSFLRQRSSTSVERPPSEVSSQATERPRRGRADSESIVGSLTSTIRRRPTSTISSDSSVSSSSSSSRSDTYTISDNSRVIEEVPVPMLEAYPEEHDDVVPPLQKQEYPKSFRSNTAKRASLDRRNRNAQIFISPPNISSPKEDSQVPQEFVDDRGRSMRESWASIDSTSTYLEGLNIGFASSTPGCRQSMASIKTFMTTDSTEAVIPRAAVVYTPPSMYGGGGAVRPSPRASIPVSLSDFDMFPEIAEDDDDIDGIYDAFPRPATFVPERPETPVAKVRFPSVPLTAGPPSPTASVSTVHSSSTGFSASTASSTTTASTTSSGDSDTLSLKVSLNNLIVMLRVSRDSSYTELRQRIFNKFIGQEGIPLSKQFKITVVVPHPNSPLAHLNKPGDSPLGTPGEEVELRIVDCQGDWETVTYATEGHKFSLRIFDNPI